jgi:hypothetical protein
MQKGMTEQQRKCLSASKAVATAAVLGYQPPLFKAAVRLVKHWAKQLHGRDWSDKQGNRWVVRHAKHWLAGVAAA